MLNVAKIEKGVPVAPRQPARAKGPARIVAEKMEVGDSCFCEIKAEAHSLANAINASHGARTSVIRKVNDGYRVWRIQATEKPRRLSKGA